MRTGFKFKGRHSSDFGIVAKTKSKPIVPEQKVYTYDLPGADGEIDMSECNEYGRTMYKSRLIEIELQISAGDLSELQRTAARIAAWLTGKGELIFDDSYGAKWDARVSSDISFAPELAGKKAVMSVVFKTDMGKATFTTGEGVLLKDCISLDSNLPLDLAEKFKFSISVGENNIKITNVGDFYTKPIFRFSDGAENVTINCNGKRIIAEDIEKDVIIDCERYIVTDSEGNNLLKKKQGSFFELAPGLNDCSVYVSGACEMTVDYVPMTMYDFDFACVDWGDGNA